MNFAPLASRCRSRVLALLVSALICRLPAEPAQSAAPLSAEAAAERVTELRAEIARADDLYFKKSAPDISDAAYDQLKRELAALDQAFPELADHRDSVAAVGDDTTGEFPRARHRQRMLSLRKSYTEAELRSFHERVVDQLGQRDAVFVVEPKFDGLAISVTYERGKLVRAITRGDGDQGDDVTANVRAIPSLPHALLRARGGDDDAANGMPDLVELRGEIFLSFAEFARINAEQERLGAEPFANPRNLAAGTLKQHNPAQVARRKLQIVFYGIGQCVPAAANPNSQRALHARIRGWGLPGVENFETAKGADEIWAAVGKIGRERSAYSFPTDGAVVKVDDAASQRELGASAEAPNWAMAFKFTPPLATTQVRAITVQIGRTGVLTPVAELTPVQLGGSVVARASLHNFSEISRRDIRVGDFVVVEKAGEIIPSIARVERSRRPAASQRYVPPTLCPVCRATVVQLRGQVAIHCPNSACPAQLRRRLAHFCGKQGVGIEGLGPASLDGLVSAGVVASIADVYKLGGTKGTTLDGKITARVLESVDRSKRAELWRFINGLGIVGVGEVSAKALAKQFGGLAEFGRAGREVYFSGGGRCRIPGVSTAAAESALAFFAQPENQELLEALVAAGVTPVRL